MQTDVQDVAPPHPEYPAIILAILIQTMHRNKKTRRYR